MREVGIHEAKTQLSKLLREAEAGTEVVILTGFPSQLSPRLRKFLEEEGGPESLNKPLRENELARTVEEIMGSRE